MLSPAWSCLDPRVDEIPDYGSLNLCPDSWGSIGAPSNPFDDSSKCLLTRSSEGQRCSLELLRPSRWFSLWFLPDLLYHILQQHMKWRCFPEGILGSCNMEVLLKDYWSSKLRSFLSAMSVASPESDNYVLVPCFFLLVCYSFFHDVLWFAPDFFLWVICLTWIFPFTFSLCGAKWGAEVPGTALLCLHSLGCLSAAEELGRVWCSWLREKI